MEQRPSYYADELTWFLYDEFDVYISTDTVYRWLRKNKITRKKLQRRAAERSQELRDDWMARLIGWTAHQLLFVDESAANECTADRKYGWAPIGVSPLEYMPVKRSERWSILPCYGIDSYITWEIIQGSFTAESFNQFIHDKVLPLTSPFPGPRSVIVMDNAKIHHTPELQAMCDEAGIILAYLPPYSPDFNPIEQLFAEMKA